MLAYYFPPLTGIASDRVSTLAELLPDFGWQPVVVTARNGFYHSAGEVRVPSCPVVRTQNPELSRAVRNAWASLTGAAVDTGSTIRPVPAGRVGTSLRGAVREFLYVPDGQAAWIPFAAAAAVRAVRGTEGPFVLFSTSVPYSAHVAAMWAARRLGGGWVAEFRDPWSTAHPINLPRAAVRRRFDRALERRIASAADHVVVISQSMRKALLEAHPELPPERTTVITNGFVPLPHGSPPDPSKPMSILYAGTVAPGEDVTPVLSALDRVHARTPGAFELVVLGPSDPWLAGSTGASDRPWLRLHGVVSPQLAHEKMRESSVLLLVQRHSAYKVIFPGKAFEYIGARRPILALTWPDWELASMLRAHADAWLIDSEDPRDLVAATELLLQEHRAGTLQRPRVSEHVTAPLQRREQASKLAAILSAVAREGSCRFG